MDRKNHRMLPSQVVCIYQKRWAIELINWELKSGLGLGEHQVSGDTNRSEKSVGIAVLAYLLVMRVCHHEIGVAGVIEGKYTVSYN